MEAFLISNDASLIEKHIGSDPFYQLINKYFRQKVANYIDSHRSELSDVIGDHASIVQYVTDLRQETFWGGEIEIQAIYRMLEEKYRIVVENSTIDLGSTEKPTIRIIHTNAKAEKDGEKNHYNLRMPAFHSPLLRPLSEPKTSPASSMSDLDLQTPRVSSPLLFPRLKDTSQVRLITFKTPETIEELITLARSLLDEVYKPSRDLLLSKKRRSYLDVLDKLEENYERNVNLDENRKELQGMISELRALKGENNKEVSTTVSMGTD